MKMKWSSDWTIAFALLFLGMFSNGRIAAQSAAVGDPTRGGYSARHGQPMLTYSAESKPAATTTGFRSVQVTGFNIFRFDGGISVQDVVVEPPKNPITPPQKSGGAALISEEAVFKRISDLSILLTDESTEQKAYQDILAEYPDKVLFTNQQESVIARLNELRNRGVALVTRNEVAGVRDAFTTLTNQEKITPSHVQNLDKKIGDLEKLVASSDTQALTTYLDRWRKRADIARQKDNWHIGPTVLVCEPQWFGRTDSQAVSLLTTDQKDGSSTQGSITITTNSCVPVLTITSGLGISTVRSSTFAFVPQTDYTKTPPVSTQVIGYSADQSVIPLYVVQMNYGVGPATSVQAHVAGGVGVSSSGAGTNADFFVGPSFSFARRAIFISPALHLTQRQSLQDGYSVGSAKADLSTVPVINKWKYGFAVTITFAVLGK